MAGWIQAIILSIILLGLIGCSLYGLILKMALLPLLWIG